MQIEIQENEELIDKIIDSDHILPLLFKNKRFWEYFYDETALYLITNRDNKKLKIRIITLGGETVDYDLKELLEFYFDEGNWDKETPIYLKNIINQFGELIDELKELLNKNSEIR